jgi:hypothetical protein
MADKFLTLSEFATQQGWRPSYVTKLKNANRLVLTKDGRVRVKQSRELIEQTAGRRSDVAARHAETRNQNAQEPRHVEEQQKPAKEKRPSRSVAEQKDELKQANLAKALAESRRVQALADKEEMERDRLAGNLVPREEVDAAFKFIGAAVRAQADVYADQTTPLVAPITDLHEVHEILAQSRKDELAALGLVIEQQRAELQNNKG